jgi:murein DD-endopeptidase MepM/ murein hydrolase activator NlpD
MVQGSVRVETGDEVEQGQVVGRIGNSGNSDAPHLHYQLMAGPVPFRSDGLPSRFDNVYLDLFADRDEPVPMPKPKRGIPLVAR